MGKVKSLFFLLCVIVLSRRIGQDEALTIHFVLQVYYQRGGSHNATPALFRCGMFATGVMALSPFPCCCVSTGVVTHVSPTMGVVTCCIKKIYKHPLTLNIDISLINFNSQTKNKSISTYLILLNLLIITSIQIERKRKTN